MSRLSRRDFVVRSAAGAAALGAGNLLGSGALAAEEGAAMAIARWGGAQPGADGIDAAAVKLTEQAVAGIGGMKRFVGNGDVVWVKPNIAWDRTPELAANTNPDVVATVVRLCLEAGAKTVKVGDHTCNVATATYQSSGIAEAARRAGAEVVHVDPLRFRETAVKGERFDALKLYPEMLECDLLVNVPIVKHHGLATATLCMKNLMGLMDDRRRYHQALPDMLTDLTRFVKPRISILDGVRILTRGGPRGGNPEDVAVKMTVAAGVDVVALDAFGAELMGKKLDEVPSIGKAQAAELGTADYRSLSPREMNVS